MGRKESGVAVAAVVLASLAAAGIASAGGIETMPPEEPPARQKPKTQAPPTVRPVKQGAPPPAAAAGGGSTQSLKRAAFDEKTFKPAPANCRNSQSFERWAAEVRAEAAAEGISQRAISSVLDGMSVDTTVISRDRKQGFFAQSFLDFSGKLATQNRITSGRAQIAKNKATFARVESQFGVPASVITGFWALESDFGGGMGNLPILRSIVTLAYDCRRGPMFREELKAAMRIIERGDMTPAQMIGSWAGEIGQTQFLPTRYLDHAIDFDGDGRINLFRNHADIIGSTANYMKHLGWRAGEPWLEEVQAPGKLPWEEADLAIKHPRSKWAAWGVRRIDGSALPSDGLGASLLLPMGRFGPAFLAYENFGVYLEWNQSLNYATTAAYLATRIDGAPAMNRGRPGIPVLSAADGKELQRQLAKRGFDVGEIDGKIGAKTRTAVKAMQVKFGMPADSYPTPELLAALRGGA